MSRHLCDSVPLCSFGDEKRRCLEDDWERERIESKCDVSKGGFFARVKNSFN